MTTLPQVPNGYVPSVERERNRKIEAGLKDSHKRGQDVEIGDGRLILTDETTGTRYEVYVDSGTLSIRSL